MIKFYKMKIELYKLILIVSCLLLINNFSNAQVNSTQDVSDHHHKPCGTDQHHDYKMQTNPEYKYFYQNQKSMVDSILRNPGDLRSYPPQYTIPVVVHVIHLGESVGTGSNISDAQIQQAIQGLNDRFRNGIGSSLDIEIDFCLATRAPNGSATNGINRVNGSGIPGFSSQGIAFNGNCGANEQAVKDLSKWSPLSYYNIWVVHQICEGWWGYAAYPSGEPYDGAVVDAYYMSDQHALLTHEIGHGFNLYHTFQGDNGSSCPPNNNCQTDGDQICDTPHHRLNDCGSSNPCSSSGNWDNSRYNYMSYCWPASNLSRFTPNQKARMRATLQVYPRQNLLNSDGCSPVECSAPTTSEFNHSNVTTTTAQLSTTASGNQFQFRYKLSSSSTWITTSESTSNSVNINSLTSSTSYDYQVRRRCSNNVWSNWSGSKTFTTSGSGGVLTMYTMLNATPNPVNQGEQMQFSFNVQNTGSSSFTGIIGVYLYNQTVGDPPLEQLYYTNEFTLPPTYIFSNNLNFNRLINHPPGTYRVIAWYLPTGSDWLQINDGNFSNVVQITVSSATCSTPTTSEFIHSNVTTTTAQLSTTAGGNQFQFRYKLSSGSTWIPTSESASTSTSISSLTSGTSYDYQVRRRCTNNVWSDWSATKMFTTTTATCPTPTGLAATATGYSHVMLNWNTVIGGSGYQTRLRKGSQNWNEGQVYSSASIIWYNMSPFTQYEFQVRAQCSSGNFSDWSTSLFITTQGQDDPYCYSYGNGNSLNDWIAGVAVGTIDNFSSNGYGYTNFTSQTTILQPNSPYYIQLTPGTNDSPKTVYWRVWIDLNGDNDFNDNGEQVFQASGLTSLSVAGNITIPVSASQGLTRMRISMSTGDYPLSCQTLNLLDVEDYSVNIISTCSAPTTSEFIHSNVATTTAQLSTTAGGNQFQFRYKLSSGSTWTTTSESASTSTSISSLTSGTSYDYQVRRRCTNNVWSNWSVTKMFTTTTATCPTPTGLTISNIGATSFTVSWNAISGATAYEIQLKQGPAGDWYNIEGNPFGGSPFNVSGVSDNMTTQCRVRSICGSSNSPYSTEVTFMTATLPCSEPTTSEFNQSNVTTISAQLSTTAGGNLFQFRHKLSSGSIWTTTSEMASNITSIGSLSAGTSYDYQVRRRCTNNVWSNWSGSRTFSTNISVQAPIANFSTSTTCGQAPLSVNFSDMSSQAPTSWLWNFGNGQTSTLQNPSVTYTIPGTYNITLNVTNEGGTHSLTKTAFVTVVSPVSVNVSSNAVCLGTPVVLTATGADTYTWTGPGLNATTGNSVTAIPPTPGIFYYTVTGTQNGCSGTSKTITIEVMPDNIFSVSLETVGCQSSDIIFKAVTQNGGSTTNILWYRNGQPVWSGPNYTLYSAVNGDKVYCEATLVNPPQCTKSEMAKSEVYTINCLSSIQGIEGLQSAMLIPNPNSGQFNLKLDITLPIKGSIRIINILGQTVYDENVSLNPGVNTIPVHLQSNTPGLYRLILQSGHGLYDKAFEVFR